MQTVVPLDPHRSFPQTDSGTRSSRLSKPSRPRGPCLPILTRSASLLELLLQDGSIDLDLTSSVVELDPSLAFKTLQLANGERCDDAAPIWQLPSAVVACGPDQLLELVRSLPRIESYFSAEIRDRLRQFCLRAVVRASMAQMLATHLGKAKPRKCFLAGLLFDIAGMARIVSAKSSAKVRAGSEYLDGALPPEVAQAIQRTDTQTVVTVSDHLPATVWLAEILLQELHAHNASNRDAMKNIAESSLWQSWPDTEIAQRGALLQHCLRAGQWAAKNVHRMEPWEFVTRLMKIQLAGARHAGIADVDRG